jgi:hypothetical protein
VQNSYDVGQNNDWDAKCYENGTHGEQAGTKAQKTAPETPDKKPHSFLL